MPKKFHKRPDSLGGIIVLCVVIIITAAGLMVLLKQEPEPGKKTAPESVQIQTKAETVIDFNTIQENQELKALMQQRKAQYGVEKGVDIIAKSNESFKIGDITVSMKEILDKIRLKSGDIIEKDLKSKGTDEKNKPGTFGIYIVQPGDNIWNIHFNFMKDYFAHKGATLSPFADEPVDGRRSSGVAKLLKFSENTVNIYNLKEHKLDTDLNLIFPLTKLVVYNMDQIFALLDLIEYEHVNNIQFDGETLWVSAN
ncbi:MAG: hypothetical protein JRJ33_03325 [Deltaproteobacteria bacterium]|nr:hypothetical protein [Deltaproteobacteria bacterium]MBW2238042.1 hypothetical protein [Deltaproteobacteria bacterium]